MMTWRGVDAVRRAPNGPSSTVSDRMRAEYRETRQYAGLRRDSVDLDAVANACRLRVLEIAPGFARLRCGLNLWSWGENIEVHLSEVDGALVVDTVSSSRIRTQIEDWGKNTKNVRRFFEALEHHASVPAAAAVPLCQQCGYPMVGLPDGALCPECGGLGARGERGAGGLRSKWRSAIVLFVGITSIELLVLFVSSAMRILPWPPYSFAVLAGAVHITVVNASVIFGILLVAKIWKPNH
jgi:hypothetical protein